MKDKIFKLLNHLTYTLFIFMMANCLQLHKWVHITPIIIILFIAAVTNLTASFCKKFNEEIHDVPGVLYQSVGSKLNKAQGGRFPLNFTYHLCNYFDGANDGFVGEKSFPCCENFEFLTVNGVRGISHGDMIDLNRENIDEFDVREYFVQLVSKLKQQGL